MRKRVAHNEQALWYEQELKEEIQQKTRRCIEKNRLKDNDKNDSPPPTENGGGSLQREQNLRFRKEQNTKVPRSNSERGGVAVKESINMFLHMQ